MSRKKRKGPVIEYYRPNRPETKEARVARAVSAAPLELQPSVTSGEERVAQKGEKAT